MITGPTLSIEDLSPEEAVAIFGRPVYEEWLRWKDHPSPPSTWRVAKVCTLTNSITLEVDE